MSANNSYWKHIRRTPYQSMSAVLTMFLTFLLAGVVFLATVTSHVVLGYFEGKPQLTVFFTEKAGLQEADALKAKLMSTGKVASTKYVSKEQALTIYREQNKKDPLLLEMVTADILPASLEVTAKEPSMLKELEPLIKGGDGVEEVVFQKDVVETLISWTNAIRLVGGVFAILLGFDSILILMTVIAMKIGLRRDELDILKLIGASGWYIRKPFVAEGAFYGSVGAVSAFVIVESLVIWQRQNLLGFLGSVPTVSGFLSNPTATPFLVGSAAFFGGMLAVGLLLGSLGSIIATGRYMRS
jgi:cell division transport system permease protein